MNRETFRQNMLELIRRTSAYLPPDVENVIQLQRKLETSGSKAGFALELVAQNIGLAKAKSLPICQDTGTINFYFETPRNVDQLELEDLCRDAVKEATKKGFLRQNSVDSVDGINTGDNLGPGSPVFHWEQTRDANIHVRLVLKGGGCENMSRFQMLTPAHGLEGIVDFVTETAILAGPNACPPIVVGVGIGGSFELSAVLAKRSLLRKVGERSPIPHVAHLEERILKKINESGIGPQGYGGETTSLAVQIEIGACHIASLPVSVNIECHAHRHQEVVL